MKVRPRVKPICDKCKVIKRNGTNAASSSSTAWGAGLGAGCTVTLYEISFCYSGVCEETGSSDVLTAFENYQQRQVQR